MQWKNDMMKMKTGSKRLIGIVFCLWFCGHVNVVGQNTDLQKRLESKLHEYFFNYRAKQANLKKHPKMLSYVLNDSIKTLTISVDEWFSMQDLSSSIVKDIYKKIGKAIPEEYHNYKITVVTNGMTIDELVPNRLSDNPDKSRMWGNTEYEGHPWVECVSRPSKFVHGLYNRHLSLWASHGRYYDLKSGRWKWQRPNLFGTTEDLFTQTIVIPYLIPMLENAGAVVFTPRERDWQKEEVIVDNDHSIYPYYKETSERDEWQTTFKSGFAFREGFYSDGENPFINGTARMTRTVHGKPCSSVSYQPYFAKAGRYAVYVSYQTLPNSIDDAQYIVHHKGQTTEFRVNQKMGDGTWVYLGTFEFDEGSNIYNRVVLTNHSKRNGVVTADAVRFGGGMGNIVRGETVSGLPRCLEGARYYSQWAGCPYSVYSSKNGADDYGDDINARSHMTNWLAGGSVYVPGLDGKRVPIELALALHSDAGYSEDYASLVGSLAICTTANNDGKLNAGMSRMASRDFADALLDGVYRDLRFKYGRWNRRALLNRNYSETRLPEVPSSILEMLAHQNFPDMMMAQDPNFKFTLARSIYKTILRYVSDQHGQDFVVEPLAPDHFSVEFTAKDKVTLRWKPVYDPQEPTAEPTGYHVYMATGTSGFDNGTLVKGTDFSLELEPDVLYHFKVTAVNKGGESFPTEVLSALYNPHATKTVLVVNGFDRLAAPAVRNNDEEQGFDLDEDIGVSYGKTAGWNGRQLNFSKENIGLEGQGGLGYCGDELAGTFIAGNDFNYVKTHAEAIRSAGRYNLVSCSDEAVEADMVKLKKYHCVDLILGLEKEDGYSLVRYKTFSPYMQERLSRYAQAGGRLLVSGAYVGSDMTHLAERDFLGRVLKLQGGGVLQSAIPNINGMGTAFEIYRMPNEQHYAAVRPDVLLPLSPAYCALQYADGNSACVAYYGKDYRCITMGFPFECITSPDMRKWIMKGILNFLLQ